MIRVTKWALGEDVRRAISEVKAAFQRGGNMGHPGRTGLGTGMAKLEPYDGKEFGHSLLPDQGGKLWKYRVGHAPGDPDDKGKRRLVIHIESDRIQHIYFTDDHYRPGSWVEVISW